MNAPVLDEAPVCVTRDDGVLIVRLNRPADSNAVNEALACGVSAAMDELDADPALRSLDAAQLQAQYAAGTLDPFARHPSQLYQAFLEGLVMFVVLWTVSRKPRPRYLVSGLFALMYGVFRFLMEFVRVPDEGHYVAWGWLTKGQILSVPLVLLGLYLLWLSRRAPTLQPVVPAPVAGK